MEYTISNGILQVTVSDQGAQVFSVREVSDGTEYMWQGDPAVWKYHAPILFPHTGKVQGNSFIAKGKEFPAKSHGFARELTHTLVSHTENKIVMELRENETTLARWPYRFRLVSEFTLEGRTLRHTLRVENHDPEVMAFGIGYHPAFRIPMTPGHTDYALRFSQTESPVCMAVNGEGLLTDRTYYLGKNITTIPVNRELFANDSHMMLGLHSKELALVERDTGRSVVCDISGFPYVLLWSAPGEPRFVCIEPWQSTPSPADGGNVWEEKPAAARLQPGESYETCLKTTFTGV